MRKREHIAAILVSLTVAASLTALGSGPRWAACMAVFLAIASALPFVGSRRVGGRGSPLVWLFGGALVLTGLQLIPLPAALVALIAPERHALMLDNARALVATPENWLALSYDTPATWLELAKIAGYSMFAYTCTRLAATERGRGWLARTVALAGLIMALCALAHHGLGLRLLFGVYAPKAEASSYLAPLLNENHLAGFLAMTVPLCIGLALASNGVARASWAASALLCASTSLLVQSRGAAVALVVGLALAAALWWLRARRVRAGGGPGHRSFSGAAEGKPLELARAVPVGVVLVCAIVLVATFTADGVRSELAQTSVDELGSSDSKLGLWRASAELARDNPWTGVGRGAFEFAFTPYHQAGLETFSHVENEYLQMLVDWGVPATALLALLMLWVGLTALRHWHRGFLELGALCGLAVVGVHSVVDFGMELPGVALCAIAMTAVLLPESLQRMRSAARRPRMFALIAAIVVAATLAAVASSPVARTARAEGDALARLLDTPEVPAERVIQIGRRAFERHPSDYLLAARLAQAYYYRKRDPKALAIQNRALTLNPGHAGLHVFTAKMLFAGNRPEQAQIEFALALRYTLEPGPILDELISWFTDPEQAARGIPVSHERMPVMINRLTTLGRADVALAYALRCSEVFDSDLDILHTVSALALEQKRVDLAVDSSGRAYRARGSARDALIFGRALVHAKRPAEAEEVVAQAIAGAERQGHMVDVPLYEVLARAQLDQGHAADAAKVLRAAIDLAVGDHPALVRLYNLLARAETALGNLRDAQRARKRAHEYSPRRDK